jgi:hypothetical protein
MQDVLTKNTFKDLHWQTEKTVLMLVEVLFNLRILQFLDYVFAGIQVSEDNSTITCYCANCFGYNGPAPEQSCDKTCGTYDNCGGYGSVAIYKLNEIQPLGIPFIFFS